MAEVLAAPQQHPPSSPSPASFALLSASPQHDPCQQMDNSARTPRHTPQRGRAPRRSSQSSLYTQQHHHRMSQYSAASDSPRQRSTAPPNTQSSLSFALVRDFAYPAYHPMHHGGPAEEPSGASTPSDWNGGRRSSESAESGTGGGKGWSAGPWGGDGGLYGDAPLEMEPLPSTSFGTDAGAGDEWGHDETSFRMNKHRKSRSFNDMPNYERGRRRESQRGSRISGGGGGGGGYEDAHDPAGRSALRHSRGFTPTESGISDQLSPSYGQQRPRRDSHFATTLPNRSFHTSQPVDPDSDLPLDAEPSDHHSPQRESMGPEDEELFAGPSLALYGFEPENENELRLIEGEVIMVSYRHGQGWLVAEKDNGEQGLVPEAYVRLLRDIEGWDEERGQFIDELEEFGDGDGHDDTTPTAEYSLGSGSMSVL